MLHGKSSTECIRKEDLHAVAARSQVNKPMVSAEHLRVAGLLSQQVVGTR